MVYGARRTIHLSRSFTVAGRENRPHSTMREISDTFLKQVTTTIPVVFAVSFDPVRDALVQSLAHPGGNVTGLSVQSTDLVGKRLELSYAGSFLSSAGWRS